MKADVKKRILVLSAALLLAAPLDAQPENLKGRVTQRITNFTLPNYENGLLTWKMTGRVAHILDNNDIILDNPALDIAAVEEKPGYTITAGRGSITDNRKVIEFEEDVTIIGTDGTSLRTDSLRWDVKTKTATTDSHISIKRGSMNLSGDGLYAEGNSRNFTINSNVNMVIPEGSAGGSRDGEGKATIVSRKSMTFKDGVATFRGDPRIISGAVTITADILELHMDPETEAITRMRCIGPAVATFHPQ